MTIVFLLSRSRERRLAKVAQGLERFARHCPSSSAAMRSGHLVDHRRVGGSGVEALHLVEVEQRGAQIVRRHLERAPANGSRWHAEEAAAAGDHARLVGEKI